MRSVVPVPSPGLRGKAIVLPEHMRARTEQGTPPPADPKPQRASRPGITTPPSKTIAHAVPPMPDLEEAASRRAATETDDSLDEAMRETEYIDAVSPDAADADNADDANGADDADDARPRRSDSEMGTGPNELAHHRGFDRVGEDTAIGLLAAPPAPPLRPGDDAEFNRAGSQAEHTSETRLPDAQPIDLMKTMEQNSKTPIPTLRTQQTPIPSLEADRRAHVPITTAPTTLPPPKQLDAAPSGPQPACPQCEAPMSWVDEHLRFYCKHCRMYF